MCGVGGRFGAEDDGEILRVNGHAERLSHAPLTSDLIPAELERRGEERRGEERGEEERRGEERRREETRGEERGEEERGEEERGEPKHAPERKDTSSSICLLFPLRPLHDLLCAFNMNGGSRVQVFVLLFV